MLKHGFVKTALHKMFMSVYYAGIMLDALLSYNAQGYAGIRN